MHNKRMIIWTLAGALTLVILLLAVTGVWAEPTQTNPTRQPHPRHWLSFLPPSPSRAACSIAAAQRWMVPRP